MNAAVTAFAPSMLTVQLPLPTHAPDHPTKVEPGSGTAVRVTVEKGENAKEAETQAASHEIPAGDDETDPAPLFETVSA